MTSPITEVAINGFILDLADVEYQVNVTHGRNDVKSQPEASSAVVSVRGDQGLDIMLGMPMHITAYGVRRFTGEVSDLSITHLSTNPPTAITTVTAIGNLSNLGSRVTGESGYPGETVHARTETVLMDSGETYINGATSVLELYAGDPQIGITCLDYLQSLAEWSGGTYFDTPRGVVVFESYGNRGLTAFSGTWASRVNPWSSYDLAWGDFPIDQSATSLPGNGVIFTPSWTQNQVSIINDVTVTHGATAHSDTVTDDTSIATYGRRALAITTGLDKHADAITRADNILTAQANPLWNLGNISVYVDQLTVTERSQVLALINGSNVIVNDLPAPAPYTQFLGIVEGWSESYIPGQHILTLSISDPRYSYQTVTWSGVSASLTWGNVNPDIVWYNVVKADDLLAA